MQLYQCTEFNSVLTKISEVGLEIMSIYTLFIDQFHN
jgi:hypothetical protein